MHHALWPPLDGSLSVVPGLVDFHATHNPDRPWVVFPSPAAPDGVGSLTFADYAKATHKVAHAYRPRREGPEGQTVGVLINCDAMHYIAVKTGLMRAGLVPVLISHRNTAEAVAHLLKKTDSHRLLAQGSTYALAQAAKRILNMHSFDITIEDLIPLYTLFPSLSPFQHNGAAKDLQPYPPAPEPWQNTDVVYILHSSGSTGLPKPVSQTQEILRQWAACSYNVEGRNRMIRWAPMVLSPFHALGILWFLTLPLVQGDAIALFPPQSPNPPIVPSPDNILETSRLTRCDGLMTVPSMLELWAQRPEHTEYLTSLRIVAYGGGGLSQASGNKLVAAGVKLNVVYGSTEAGSSVVAFDLDDSRGPGAPWRTSGDWEYCRFADYTRPRWVPHDDGTYELHLLTSERHQPAVENLRDTRGYNTSDLWEPHPSKPGYWRIVGRTDDVIVLSSGEKVVPAAPESHMLSSPCVKGAVMFGRTRLQPGLLLEPAPGFEIDPRDETQLAKFRNLVWPAVEEANQLGPSFARVFKETILVSSPEKPLPRAAKDTVQRKSALDLYRHEIDKLYESVEDSTDSKGIAPPVSWRAEDVEEWLMEHAASLNGGFSPPVDVDIFMSGFDSLNATLLRNRIIGGLRTAQNSAAQNAAEKISQNFIFDHPQMVKMAKVISGLVDPSSASVVEKDRTEHIIELIEKYSANLPRPRGGAQPAPALVSVLVTGSTGNLGSHLVAALLAHERVARVYTFDRANSGATPLQRLGAAFNDRGLPAWLLANGKLRMLTGSLDDANFGLPPAMFQELRRVLTHAVHNAWKVNFNHSLGSFETQISGTRKLLDFCAAADNPVKLLFTSSISSAHGWNPAAGPVPEHPLPDPELATKSGYAASKYVVEQVLARAAQNGMETTSLRIGQLCGSKTTGAWNTTDWVPMMIKSGLTLGALPRHDMSVDWMPLDTVADALTELILSAARAPDVLNVVHPRRLPWDAVLGAVNDALGADLPLVPFDEWLAKLEAMAGSPVHALLAAVPAIKILDFFRDIGKGPSVEFATDRLQQHSTTVRELRPLNPEHAQAWVAYWTAKGLFDW